MPNDCNNTLYVKGDEDLLTEFKARARSTEILKRGARSHLCFNNFVPIPEDKELQLRDGAGCYLNQIKIGTYKPTHEEQLRDAWYNWSVHNWGTKWDAYEVSVAEDVRLLTYQFCTAWSPPLEGLKKVSAQYPELVFTMEYWELGNDFAGEIEFKNGRQIFHKEGVPAQFDFAQQENFDEEEVADSGT